LLALLLPLLLLSMLRLLILLLLGVLRLLALLLPLLLLSMLRLLILLLLGVLCLLALLLTLLLLSMLRLLILLLLRVLRLLALLLLLVVLLFCRLRLFLRLAMFFTLRFLLCIAESCGSDQHNRQKCCAENSSEFHGVWPPLKFEFPGWFLLYCFAQLRSSGRSSPKYDRVVRYGPHARWVTSAARVDARVLTRESLGRLLMIG